MRWFVAVATMLGCLAWAATPPAAVLPPPNAQAISAAYMQDVLYFLSSDVMEGRNTPSRGYDTAALYIASNLAQWGLKGGGDAKGDWDPKLGPLAPFLYHFALESSQIEPQGSEVDLGGQHFAYGQDFTAAAVGGKGSGKLLFVGPGYVQRKQGVDPYRGLDVRGNILVVDGAPPELVAYEKDMLSYYQAGMAGAPPQNPLGAAGTDYLTPQQYAATHGALAVVSGNQPGILAAFAGPAATPEEPSTLPANPYPDPPPNVPPMQVVRFAPPGTQVVSLTAESALWQAIEAAKNDPGARLGFTVAADVRHARTEDVVGILPGSDPELAKQYLVISAHLDHLGINAKRQGDFINNGADDDGSGSTGLLNLAKAFASGPRPKRSIAFIWHAGEEKGLWGSLYFTRYPTIPIHQVITDLNMDMIGRTRAQGDNDSADRRLTRADEIYVIGPQVSSSDLERTLDAVNAANYKLKLNHYYDRTDDPERIFYRSDHVNYANQGIPILFFFDGVHVDYHKPGDEPQKIDYQKMEKVTRTVYAIGWQLANQASTPKLNAVLPGALVQAMAAAQESSHP